MGQIGYASAQEWLLKDFFFGGEYFGREVLLLFRLLNAAALL